MNFLKIADFDMNFLDFICEQVVISQNLIMMQVFAYFNDPEV